MGCGIDKKAMRDVMALVESVGHFAPISTVVEETSLTNKETVHDLMNLVAEYEYAVKELKFQGNQAKRDPDASAQEMMDAVEANLQRMDRVTAKIRKIVLGESIGQVVCPARAVEAVVEASAAEVSPKHRKLLKLAAKEKGVSEDEILKMWNADKPHFGGDGPHRYDDGAKECSYCLRPKDWVPQKEVEGGSEEVKWLPSILEKEVKAFVGKVSSAAKWDGYQAYAFCVALLEDVNAHPEAKAVNELLLKEYNKDLEQNESVKESSDDPADVAAEILDQGRKHEIVSLLSKKWEGVLDTLDAQSERQKGLRRAGAGATAAVLTLQPVVKKLKDYSEEVSTIVGQIEDRLK